MNIVKLIGIALIVAGLLGLAFGSLSYTYKDKVVDVGSVQVTRDKTTRLPVPPLAAGLFLAAGVVLLVRDGRS